MTVFHIVLFYVVSGKFEVTIEGKMEVLETGDAFVVPSDALHGAVCIESGVLIEHSACS